jgi:hypothetical protein
MFVVEPMGNKNNINNNKLLENSLAEAEKIIGRLKEVIGVTTDGQLANYLGISRQNIGAARKRGDVPPGWINKVAASSGCSMDWLRFGHGPKIRADYTTEGSRPDGQVASPQSPYDFQAGGRTDSADELQRDGDSSGFGAAVEMLAKIYGSGDHLLIRTITANIRAFCEAIDRKDRHQRSTRELQDLKKRLTTIEKQLQQTRPARKKGRKPKS